MSNKYKGSFQQTETRQSRFHTQTKVLKWLSYTLTIPQGATKQAQTEVMKLDFDDHKIDLSKAESENPLDYSSLHQDIENIIMRRCPSEPLPLGNSLTKEIEANILASKRK